MRKALGKGLSALIPVNEDPQEGSGMQSTADSENIRDSENLSRRLSMIPISKIKPNPMQPRKFFDPEKLAELSASIRNHGVLEPVLATPDATGDGYHLVAGERRLRAAQLAGLKEIPAIIKDSDPEEQRNLVLAMVENLQRQDLNPLEEALGCLKLIREFNFTQTAVAEILGKSKSAVSNSLRLLDLPDEMQNALGKGAITEGHARALLMAKDPIQKDKLFRMILSNGLSVRDSEYLAKDIAAGKTLGLEGKREASAPRDRGSDKTADVRAIESELQTLLGTKVEIRARADGRKGSILIHFYGLEDFERVVGIIKK